MPNETKGLSLYWKCQLIGWSLASLYWTLMGIVGTNFSVTLAIVHFIGDLCIYILPTHLFRAISLHYHWGQLRPKQLLPIVIPAVILLGLAFMLLTLGKNYLIGAYLHPQLYGSFATYFSGSWMVTWMTGIRLMSIWILAYYAYHFAQAEIKANQENARLALIAKNAQLEHLRAQLNPHFFFNSLNNIKGLVIENPNGARRAIDLLSDLLRSSLYGGDATLIPLQQEMDLIGDYLELEKMRFENRLQWDIKIDENLTAVLILPLCIQTLIENAIKHGIAQQKTGGTIVVRVGREQDCLTISVRNEGTLTTAPTQGLGLKNLKERLELQFNGKASFSLVALGEDIVLATLLMPIHEKV